MTFAEGIMLLIIVGIYWFIRMWREYKFTNYMPPDGYRVDHGKQVRDHVSRDELKRKTVAGEYDVPVEDYIKKK